MYPSKPIDLFYFKTGTFYQKSEVEICDESSYRLMRYSATPLKGQVATRVQPGYQALRIHQAELWWELPRPGGARA